MSEENGSYSSTEVCRMTGLSYRTLDLWCNKGVIPEPPVTFGSGSNRRFTRAHIDHIESVKQALKEAVQILYDAGCPGHARAMFRGGMPKWARPEDEKARAV